MRQAIVALMCLAIPVVASAQNDFSRLTVKPGRIVFVTDTTTGVEVSGPLARLSARELAIDGYHFEPRDGLKIEREGDTVWDGAAIGFAVGALSGVTIGAEGCLQRPMWHCALETGIAFAGLGALIDWGHSGRTTIYVGRAANRTSSRWTVVPSVTAHGARIAVSVPIARLKPSRSG